MGEEYTMMDFFNDHSDYIEGLEDMQDRLEQDERDHDPYEHEDWDQIACHGRLRAAMHHFWLNGYWRLEVLVCLLFVRHFRLMFWTYLVRNC